MKRLNYILIPAMMSLAALFVSCTEEPGSEPVTPVFPEEKTEFIEPGQTADIAFTANMDWTASISADDAKGMFILVDGSQEVYSVRGKAGDVVVKVRCKKTEQDFDNYSIDLSLTMGGETRKIATVTLPAKDRQFGLKSADLNEAGDGFKESADGTFTYSYTGEAVADKGDITMLWLDSEKAYKQHILVDCNYRAKITAGEGLDYKLEKTSGTGIEYVLTVAEPNLTDSEKKVAISFAAEDDGTLVKEFNVVIPKFNTVFNVYPVMVDEDNVFVDNDDPDLDFYYKYGEKPLAENAGIDFIFNDSNIAFDYSVLVEANFAYEISKPDWLTIRTTAGDHKTEYRLSIETENLSGTQQEGKLEFSMTGADRKYVFNLRQPDCKELFVSTLSKNLEFNSEGQYKGMYGDYTPAAQGFLTTAGEPRFYKFEKQGDEYVSGADWIEVTYDWGASPEYVKNNQIRINTTANEMTEVRSGLVVACPAFKTVENPDDLLTPEYQDYVIAYIEQAAPVETFDGAIIPVEYEMWADYGATFSVLPKDSYGWLAPDAGEFYRIKNTKAYQNQCGGFLYFTVAEKCRGHKLYDYDGSLIYRYDGQKYYDQNDIELEIPEKKDSPDIVANYWVVLENAWKDNYTATMYLDRYDGPSWNPKSVTYVFYDTTTDKDVAVLECLYEPSAGGSGDEGDLMFVNSQYAAYDGSTLTLLDLEDEENAGYKEFNENGEPMYLLAFTKRYPTMSQITGLPDFESFTTLNNFVQIEQQNETDYMVSLVDPETEETYIMDILKLKSSTGTVLSIIVTFDISEE